MSIRYPATQKIRPDIWYPNLNLLVSGAPLLGADNMNGSQFALLYSFLWSFYRFNLTPYSYHAARNNSISYLRVCPLAGVNQVDILLLS